VNFLFSYFKTQIARSGTIQLVGAGILLLAVGTCIGVADNPPGIFLSFLGILCILFAFVHHWREAGQFGTLLAVSVISFPVLVLLHNIFEAVNEQIGHIPVLDQFLEGLSVMSFLAAIFVAPAGITIGSLVGLFYLLRGSFTEA